MNELSKFIMEYDINTTNVGDIYLEQALAEINVLGAYIDCMIKESYMMEHASEPSEFCVFQEAADGEPDDRKWYQKVFDFIKKVVMFIPNLIINALSKNKLDRTIETYTKKAKAAGVADVKNYPLPIGGMARTTALNIKAINELMDNMYDKGLPFIEEHFRSGDYDSTELIGFIKDLKDRQIPEIVNITQKGQDPETDYTLGQLITLNGECARLKERCKQYKTKSGNFVKSMNAIVKSNLSGIENKDSQKFSKDKANHAMGLLKELFQAFLAKMNETVNAVEKYITGSVQITYADEKKALNSAAKQYKKAEKFAKGANEGVRKLQGQAAAD